MTADPKAVAWDDCALEKVTEMVSRRVHVDRGTGTILVQTHLRRGALVPRHTHAGEQSVHVMQGAIRLQMAGDALTLRSGGTVQIPANTPHQIDCGEEKGNNDRLQGAEDKDAEKTDDGDPKF